MDNVSFFGSAGDLLLRANYADYLASIQANPRVLPITGDGPYGAASLSAGASSLVDLKAWIDTLIAGGLGGECHFHPGTIGLPGYITLADFQAYLDYIAAKVALGTLVVMTPTAQLYATPV
jgi:hypothetical protein